eukprot:1159014-Pelagomonas_calceolata.AAC.1
MSRKRKEKLLNAVNTPHINQENGATLVQRPYGAGTNKCLFLGSDAAMGICYALVSVCSLVSVCAATRPAVHGIRRKGLQGVGLQPENLADRLLAKHSHPPSKIVTNSDKNCENLYES